MSNEIIMIARPRGKQRPIALRRAQGYNTVIDPRLATDEQIRGSHEQRRWDRSLAPRSRNFEVANVRNIRALFVKQSRTLFGEIIDRVEIVAELVDEGIPQPAQCIQWISLIQQRRNRRSCMRSRNRD